MEVSYRKNLSRSYMCIEEQGQPLESYELHMLEGHSISNLLHLQTVLSEGKYRYLYDISGKQQIEDYFAGKKISYETLQRFLFSVHSVCADLSEYLLREGGLCLEQEFIYVNLEDGSWQFTYLPFYDKNLPEAFEACMEQLLRKLDHQDKEAVELGYHVYQLCAGGNIDIGQILKAALEKRQLSLGKKLPKEAGGNVWENAADLGKCKEAEEEVQKIETHDRVSLPKRRWRQKLENCKMQFKETIEKYLPGLSRIFARVFEKVEFTEKKTQQNKAAISEKTGKKDNRPDALAGLPKSAKEVEVKIAKEPGSPSLSTEILSVREKEPLGKLVYKGVHDCEDILVEGEEFLLGKNSEQVSGVILAEGVSRLHARITCEENKYFIEDLNSTNGTYLNEIALEYHQPQELKSGDKIRFGAEEYIFS